MRANAAPGKAATRRCCDSTISTTSEQLFAESGDIAAVMLEPMLANAGCIHARPGYLPHVEKVARRHGAVVILDEVLMGFRTLSGWPGRPSASMRISPPSARRSAAASRSRAWSARRRSWRCARAERWRGPARTAAIRWRPPPSAPRWGSSESSTTPFFLRTWGSPARRDRDRLRRCGDPAVHLRSGTVLHRSTEIRQRHMPLIRKANAVKSLSLHLEMRRRATLTMPFPFGNGYSYRRLTTRRSCRNWPQRSRARH